jgi:Tol biopolymer transport system component
MRGIWKDISAYLQCVVLTVLLCVVGSWSSCATEYEFREEPLYSVGRIHQSEGKVSGDGCRYALIVELEEEKHQVLLDGRPVGPPFDWIDKIRFSPDGKRLVFVGSNGNGLVPGPKTDQLILDGTAQPSFESIGIVNWSPDGKRLAYVAKKDGKYGVIEEGKGETIYDGIEHLTFSPDGKRLAYIAKQGKQFFVVLDGRRLNDGNQGATWLTFSGDSKAFAYVLVVERGRERVVVGEKTFDVETAIGVGPVALNTDGTQYAYVVHRIGNSVLVLNGREIPGYATWFMPASPVFSPDGRRVAYPLQAGARCVWSCRSAVSC